MTLRPIYYDTETTGVKPDKDRIIEIAAFDPISNRTFCEFINPGMPIPSEATAVHQITDLMVANSPSFEEVGERFIEFCGPSAVLVAHNNDGFDRPFLLSECGRNQLTPPSWAYVDSLKWARKFRPDLPRHSLQSLREVYQIPPNQAHRALDDVMVLYQVFSFLIDDLPIEAVIELLSNNNSYQRMPFGKHQGKPLKDVPKEYISWLHQNGAFERPENTELKASFEKLGFSFSL